ncbi:hypothetical protein VKT23_013801 [Stygiomarasmius scandens]|uniref:Uncharacterized protein n=1 Tax=Marasmiellus scandens TaxID=2682957 RepID=A0ABR1J1V6_9AGAR
MKLLHALLLATLLHLAHTQEATELSRRKGGGGGHGGHSGGRSSGSRSSSSGGSHSSSSGKSSPISFSGNGKSASTTSNGGGTPIVIPNGEAFSGRSFGGGDRQGVYGTRIYGSGYPPTYVGSSCTCLPSYCPCRGVANRGFPFYFWPLVWGGATFALVAPYLYTSLEYGLPTNTSRPGGAETTVPFISVSNGTIFRILSDNTTITSLITSIQASGDSGGCGYLIKANGSGVATPYQVDNSSSTSDTLTGPRPEQAIQYYRASSVVLTLDGYNNSVVYESQSSSNTSTSNATLTDTPLPLGIDTTLLDCLNQTIGKQVLLVDGAVGMARTLVLRMAVVAGAVLGLVNGFAV